jgi:hypothetical protein
MKKVTLNTILSLIATIDTPEAEAVRAELNAELNKGKEKADANRALYDEAHDAVIGALSDTPVTLAELYEEVKDKVTLSKGKIQYALGHYWENEVTVIEGTPNTYAKA